MPDRKKAPFTSGMVKKVIDKYAHPPASLSDPEFLRFKEVAGILPTHLEFKVTRSK